MSHTTTINCARVSFEDGEAIECGCKVEIELIVTSYGRNRPATHWDPEEHAEIDVAVDYIPTGCPTRNRHGVHRYTEIEDAEMERRADAAAAEYVPEPDMDYAGRCRCGDVCRC